MDDKLKYSKPQPILEDLMQNAFPCLFYIFFPGLMFGFYFSIPLGFIAAFVGFFMFSLHCHLVDIKIRLDSIIKSITDNSRN